MKSPIDEFSDSVKALERSVNWLVAVVAVYAVVVAVFVVQVIREYVNG